MAVEGTTTPAAAAAANTHASGGVAAWRRFAEPLWIFTWSRLVLWIGALAALELVRLPRRVPALFGIAPEGAPPNWVPPWLHEGNAVVDVWARWDSAWFVKIAEHGYDSAAGAPAFYPLYPSLVGAFGRMLGGHYVTAGVIVSLVSSAAAFVLLHRVAGLLLGPEGAQRSVLYFALFPMSVFLAAVYSESLFVALAAAAFWFVETRRLPSAATVAALACLTRPTGFVLLPALLLLGWQRGERRRLAWLALAPVGFVTYPLLLVAQGRRPFSFFGVETSSIWLRHVSPAGPLGGIWNGLHAGAEGVRQFVVGGAHSTWPVVEHENVFAVATTNVEYLLYLVLFVALIVVAWRRLPAGYALYATLGLMLPLSTPSERWPLLSLPRFGVVLFPLFIALGALGASRRLHRVIVPVSAVLLGVAVTQWALWQWVS